MAPKSIIDKVYRCLLLSKFFVKGWGKPENLHRIFTFRKILSNKEQCYRLVDRNTPVQITSRKDTSSHIILEGHFESPFEQHLPGLMPEACKRAHFQMLLPRRWARQNYKPVCIQLAGTGEHGYGRRRLFMAKPLLEDHGIASIMLENPFYGFRKPPEQRWSRLLNVSDLFVMGGCLILECMVLLHWCRRQGLGPLGISGISMGGHMASLAACSWPTPIPLVPCLSWTTASGVFTQGLLSKAINWELLRHQYLSNKAFRDELFNLIHSPEGHFSVYHEVGQHFARDFPNSMNHIENIVIDDLTDTNTFSDTKEGVLASDASSHQASKRSSQKSESVSSNVSDAGDHLSKNENIVSSIECSDPPSDKSSNIVSELNLNSNGGFSNNILDFNGKPVHLSATKSDVRSFDSAISDSKTGHAPMSTNESFPPQFSHIETLNELHLKPNLEQNSVRESDDTNRNPDRTTDIKISSPKLDFPDNLIAQTTKSTKSSIYGLQYISKDVPAFFSSAMLSTGKFGGMITKSIVTTLNSFPLISKNVTNSEKSNESINPNRMLAMPRLSFLFSRFREAKMRKLKETSSKTTLKVDPHNGFSPVGIRPANTKNTKQVTFIPYRTVKDPVTWEALQFMRGIMDECTHVGNFGTPTDAQLIIIVKAIRDAYEPTDFMQPMDEVWPGSELRTINTGHILGYVTHRRVFRAAINDAFQRSYVKYGMGGQWVDEET